MQLSTFQKANNMTKNTKIIIGVGAIALAYYLFKDKFKGGGASTQTPSVPQNTGDSPKVYYCKDGFKQVKIDNKNIQNIRYEPPCEGHGGIDELKTNGGRNTISEPSTIPSAYRLKEDFSRSVMTRPNVYVDVTFKKGQIISALKSPYLPQNKTLFTTIKGEKPNFEMVGQPYISIPENILERL